MTRTATSSGPPKPPTLLGSAPRARAEGAAASDPIVIVGGGISGLTLAYELTRAQVPFELFEGSERFGGNIRTERVGEFLFDVGPDSFLRTRPEALELCRALGLEDELLATQPEGRAVYLAREGRLERMPEGLSLGVPMSLGALLDCPSLDPVGKLRAMLEPFVPRGASEGEESIASFLRRRLGPQMADRLAAPLLAGVFAGDAERLSMRAAFPQLVALEQGHGSLVRGMLRGRSWTTLLRRPATQSGFATPRGGLSRLIERLVEEIPSASLRRGCPVTRVAADGDGFELTTAAGTRRARAVALSVPPWRAAELLGGSEASGAAPFGALARELASVRGSATATVFFAFEAEDVALPLDGSGFIVPEGEGRILAATWVSSKWAARAPRGKVLIRAFVGGARAPELLERTDGELGDLGLAELRRFMGHLGQPLFCRVYRYPRGNPQPELGHLARLDRVRKLLAELPGLFLIGSGYGGVGIPDCVRQAREAAQLLVEGRASA